MNAGSIDWLLCAGTTKRASFVERVEAAARAGFAGITLFPEHYLDARDAGRKPADLRSVLGDHGIRVHQVDPLLDWFGPGISRSEALLYEAAHAVGAVAVNVAPAFAPSGEASFLTDCLGRLSARAASEGLAIDLEPLPWSAIPDLDMASRLVGACGAPNVGIMLDSWHFFRAGGEVADITPDTAARISGLQLNDLLFERQERNLRVRIQEARALAHAGYQSARVVGALRLAKLARCAVTPGDESLAAEAITRRLLPGEGEAPVALLLRTLRSAGYSGPVGIEVFSTALHRANARTIADRAMQAAGGLLVDAPV